jgi:ATP-dependent Clp protease ATP-binding subunit ClpA
MGFMPQDHHQDGSEVIKKTFTPEFRNRLDAIIHFKPLSMAMVRCVVDKFLTELQAQLDEKHVLLDVDEEAKTWLAKHGYDKAMGARPMARLIQERLKKPLADEILFGDLAARGGQIRVVVKQGGLHIEREALAQV